MGPATFSFGEVQLPLLISLVLLPSREGFRKIAIRSNSHLVASALAWLAVLGSTLLSLAVVAAVLL